ncbi:prolactin-3D1 isoform 1 precursor [Mus musculus]|uniref:Growth hormone d4 n=1 Tax=Mus musculus TaxID=10090 RepID=A0A286YC78_MOUSE|nr:prolactin-3D1 isoform 1 precursor [Mus musculus]EDL32450.1 mCG20377, isoform CRA_a [Mus musculus]CDW51418.1 TPA: growth hormone d4 [Mus musculus]|eukprot:NP_001192251.1 prolactin-3D1 isoform 1 precursor [Mus musculus]
MQLTLNLSGSAGMQLLLLVSSLLLWENVSSKPTAMVPTEDLYTRLAELSHNTFILAADVYREFDLDFFDKTWITDRTLPLCHTASIHTPENREEVHETKTEDLLKAMINVSISWKEPLKHLVSALTALPGASESMGKKAADIKGRNLVILEGLQTIYNRTQANIEENENFDYPAWSGLEELQSPNEDTHLFAVYNLCRCIKRDIHKIDSYIKVLRCRVVFQNEC